MRELERVRSARSQEAQGPLTAAVGGVFTFDPHLTLPASRNLLCFPPTPCLVPLRLLQMSAKQQDVLHARHTQEGLRELNKLDVAESLLQSADALEKFTDPNGSFMQRAASNRGTKSGGPTWA